MLTGFAGFLVSSQFDGYGILTFVQIGVLGVSAAALSEYRSECGLWMLALLMLLIWGGLHVLGITMEIRDVLRGVRSALPIVVDSTIATIWTTIHIRFLYRVSCYNYQLRSRCE